MKVRYFMAPPRVSSHTTSEPEPDRHARKIFRRPVIDDQADTDPEGYFAKGSYGAGEN
jgi:hypothetical protein